MDRSHIVGRKPKPVAETAHPLVKLVFEESNMKYSALARKIGIQHSSMMGWRLLGADPKLSLIEAALNAVGYDLVAVKRGQND
jgi:hypothetical protein